MAAPVHDKYFLKSLHDEIDLFDRKLAHMLKYESFPTDAARQTSASKMQAKRDTLARTARQLASEGIEFKASDLPRSFRGDDPIEAPVPTPDPALIESAPVPVTPSGAGQASGARSRSPFAGTVLDGHSYVVEAYKRSRAKATS